MVKLQSIAYILSLPPRILIAIVRYFLGNTEFRKYRKRLRICIKLTLYRWALGMTVPDIKVISMVGNRRVFKAMKLLEAKSVNSLPSFGEPFGDHAVWIAKHPQRLVHDPIIIFSYGGGYLVQAQLEQFKSLVTIYKHLDPAKKYSMLFLDYNLVCFGHKFPRQLLQLALTYTHLVEQGNDNLVLMGDSAGGHLSITFIKYIYHVRPWLPYPTQLVLVSPWCKLLFNADDECVPGRSYNDNMYRDLIDIRFFRPDSKTFFYDLNKLENHPYFGWCVAGNHTDWQLIPFFKNPNSRIYLIYGEDDSFRDHAIEWANSVYGANNLSYTKTENQLIPECTTVIKNPDQAQLISYMEPWGVHDATFFTEYDCIKKLDKQKHFGVTRMIDFLNGIDPK